MGFLRYGGGSFLVVLVAHRKGHGSKAAKGTRGGTATSKVQQEYLFQADIAGVSGLEKGSHSRRLQHG